MDVAKEARDTNRKREGIPHILWANTTFDWLKHLKVAQVLTAKSEKEYKVWAMFSIDHHSHFSHLTCKSASLPKNSN